MQGLRRTRLVEVVPGPEGVAVVLDGLPAALEGEGPALAVAPAGADAVAARARSTVQPDPAVTVDADVAVVLPTSGSTGAPRGVLLPGPALLASATATLDRIGGPAAWTLALPVTSVAGVTVLVRSLMAGVEPVVVPSVGGARPFSAPDFAAATWALDPELPGATALVPAQAALLLDHPEGLAALQAYDAVLIGGARTPPALMAALRAAHVAAIATYGMTETCGGLVYDGEPLPGAEVRIDDADSTGTGTVVLGGPMVARGYLGDPAATEAAFVAGWHRSRDLGRLSGGRLEVLGRSDDVVQVGGVNVAVSAVEDALAAHVEAAVVLAVPDPRWGARLTAYVVGAAGEEELSAAVAAALGRAAVPRGWVRLTDVPLLPNGKPDRDALRALG